MNGEYSFRLKWIRVMGYISEIVPPVKYAAQAQSTAWEGDLGDLNFPALSTNGELREERYPYPKRLLYRFNVSSVLVPPFDTC